MRILAVAETATAQITAAIIVTAVGCPILVSFLHRLAKPAATFSFLMSYR